MPCDLDGICPFPGAPGTDGALLPENHDIVRIWQMWKALGPWALAHLNIEMGPMAAQESIYLIYILELENRRLRREYTFQDHALRMIWDID